MTTRLPWASSTIRRPHVGQRGAVESDERMVWPFVERDHPLGTWVGEGGAALRST